ncbi:helix-turn-helix transcriptional regulator [Pseudomonas putida]|uniref:response regulator transcription factor n=1 Tax=Pseudomonas putida TaxID=303 RepID=UPI0018AAECF8|nr:LuxR C-terminal-related transcriptional regulator [Pseudomonas putida]MBF8651320.1 helix-turn-helix transcriptional regulator [Pseudomonas putida]MBF8655016.1 helix-turn-helix transcriptional regulator [Pseudomonas putida]
MHAETITANGFVGFLGRGAAPRELECLMAIASGQTSKQAARDLGVSSGSIDKRLLALTTKLGVTRRAALVAEAFKRGLITPAVMVLCAILVGHTIASDDVEFNRTRRSGERRVAETRILRRADCALAVA